MQHQANENKLHMETTKKVAADTASMPSGDSDVSAITGSVAGLTLNPGSVDAAVAVFTDPSLLACIGSFQQNPRYFVLAYREKLLGGREGSEGFLVGKATASRDVYALKMFYTARRLDPKAAEKSDLSFQRAMDSAVSLDRLKILPWLYAQSQQHPDDVQTSPDDWALLYALRVNPTRLLQAIFNLHADDIDAKLIRVLARALHDYSDGDVQRNSRKRSLMDRPVVCMLSPLQLLLQRRPALHPTALKAVAGAGSVAAVKYMLSSRSGIDMKKVVLLPAISAAARSRHWDVVELLVSAKRDDEVIDITAVRDHLSSVGDAGALQLLSELLAQRDPSVRLQLEEERQAARSPFGCSVSSSETVSGPTTKRKTARKTAGRRSKPGRR